MGAPVDLIKRMIDAGMSNEDVTAVMTMWAEVRKLEARRENDRNRQQTSRDSRDKRDIAAQRKVSPDPSKEITIPTSSVEETSEVAPLSIVFPSKADLEWAVAEWNELAGDTGLPAVKALNAQRRRSLTHRLRELGHREAWTDALMLVARSPFCCGENDRGWRANFDFVLQPSSMAKLLEGNYGKIQERGG